MSQKSIRLSLVVPCLNEEEVLAETAHQLSKKLYQLATRYDMDGSAIYFVDDGSIDETWKTICTISSSDPFIRGLKLSRNFGHQNALMAGMLTVPGDIIVTLDADLQDDVDVIDAMIEAYLKGADIVYAVRSEREVDTFSKQFSAHLYYRIARFLGVKLIFNHGDFRLLSRRAIEVLRLYPERNLFLRAMVPQLGFQTEKVFYKRKARKAGVSKYRIDNMLSLALEGVTSFSIHPLRLAAIVGLGISLGSFGLAAWALVGKLLYRMTVPGWASTVVPIYFISGVQLLFLGIIGEYIGKIYLEIKQRPRFLIEKKTWDEMNVSTLNSAVEAFHRD